ncbi:unnamed protein product [Phytophthora lilii]|uniref:Unnamed protein product n=1 Tax=Phytophthora lilii TaxID=2077276 RepID=A0A9W6WRM0_9STRA|nr:unnamed protein product [Phytophthora lilii]
MDRSEFPHLTDLQFESVRKMGGIFGMDVLRSLAAATPAEQIQRVTAFDMYERGLIDNVQGTLQVPRTEPKVVQPKPLKLKVHPYEGKEGENLHFWVREVELAMDAALISDEQLRVAFALSHLSGRAKTWAYTREAALPGCFASWSQLCEQLRAAFLPANVHGWPTARPGPHATVPRAGQYDGGGDSSRSPRGVQPQAGSHSSDGLACECNTRPCAEWRLRVWSLWRAGTHGLGPGRAARHPLLCLWEARTHGASLSCIRTMERRSSQAPGSERSLAEAAITGPEECRTPVGAGRPTGEDLSLHERCAGGAHHGGLAPESLCTLETEKGSDGLLVVQASVRGYSNPFRVLIDSGASKIFARRQTVARNGDTFADTLRENEGNGLVSVRLADGTVVEVPRVHMDLAVKFKDFDGTEQFIVLKMDKYDLILGMPWLEKHEPWIDWRGKTIGASRPAVSERALVSHVPTSARYQGVQRDRLDATASEVLAGVVEEKSDPDAEVAVTDATGRRTRSTTDWAPCPACEPVMPTSLDAESRCALRASTVSALSSADEVGNIGPPAGNRVPRAAGAAGVGNQVPHERSSCTKVLRSNVVQDAVVYTQHVAQTITDREGAASASCAGNQVPHHKVGNIVPRVAQTITDEEGAESASCVRNLVPHDAGNIVTHEAEISEESVEDASCEGNVVPCMVEMTDESEVVIDTSSVANTALHDPSEARNAPLREASHVDNMEPRDGRRQRPCQVSDPLTNPATVTEGYTEPGALRHKPLKIVITSSMARRAAVLRQALSAWRPCLSGDGAPQAGAFLNSSSVMHEAVLEELKKRREARLGSEVLKNPKDPVYPLLTEFADVVSKDPPSQLPPDRGIRHEIDLVPGTNEGRHGAEVEIPALDANLLRSEAEREVASGSRLQQAEQCDGAGPDTDPKKGRVVKQHGRLHAVQRAVSGRRILPDPHEGESDIPLTAVSTPSGMLWEWLVMPHKGFPMPQRRLIAWSHNCFDLCVRERRRTLTTSSSIAVPRKARRLSKCIWSTSVECWRS